MLFHSLTFLCLGVYMSTQLPSGRRLLASLDELKSLDELQRYLNQTKEVKLIPKNASMTSVEMPSNNKENCTIYYLDIYLKAFNSLEASTSSPKEVAKSYSNMVECLRLFIEKNPLTKYFPPKNENQDCKESVESIKIEELLEEFKTFLQILHHRLENKPVA